jgi:hypothetical protein
MFIAWLCGASSLAVTWIQARWYVFHPHYLPLTILFVGLALATLVGMGCGLWRAIRGPDRWRAALKVCAILPPVCIWGHVGLTARANWSDRWVPNTFAMRIAKVMGVTLMRLEADFAYRRRLESDRILMYYDPHRSPYVEGVDRPDEDLAAMDRHLARLEDLLGERISGQVYWIRGPALGSEFLSLHGLALGSAWSPKIPDSYRGDRHELAHAALDSFRMPGSDPPYVLHEGWAMAQCGDSRLELAKAAAKLRAEIPEIGPRELFGPTWYYRCTLPVYSIGGAFVEFLIRTFDAQRFLRFYTECTPTNVDDKCEELFQVNIDDLEAAFWKDVDRSLRDAAPPNTTLSVP